MIDDAELLRRYAEQGADDAFAELVRRHVNLVYSAALRQLNGDAHLAADATQRVFTDLARKAGKLSGHRVLAGWLFTSTRFTAAKLVRGERRWQAREKEARLMQELMHDDATAPLDWERVRPVIDEALGALGALDRDAILLRFFEGRDYATIGARLNLAENAARMRVERALDKLHALLERRGVTSTSAALATALASQAVIAAPAGLAALVTGAALTGGAVTAAIAGGAAAGGASAAIGFMSMTKLQLGLAGALAAAGATGFVVQAKSNAALRDEIAQLRTENSTMAAVQAERDRLSRTAAEVDEMRRDDTGFVRLQEEAAELRSRLQQLARSEAARVAAARTADRALDIASLDQTPTPRFMARPQYPAELRRAGVAAEVVVDFVVDANGDVKNAFALRSTQRPADGSDVTTVRSFVVAASGQVQNVQPPSAAQPEFEAAAVAAVNQWKFKPGRKGGQDVATHLQVPIVFTLNQNETAPAASAPR